MRYRDFKFGWTIVLTVIFCGLTFAAAAKEAQIPFRLKTLSAAVPYEAPTTIVAQLQPKSAAQPLPRADLRAVEMTPAETQPDLAGVQVLDLITAGRMAIAHNPDMAAALSRIEQAKLRVRQAQAAYWPRVDASASAASVRISDRDKDAALATARFFNPSADIDNPDEQFGLGVTASWVVFDGFERKFRRALAQYAESSSTAAYTDAQRLLLSAVANAFFGAQLGLEDIAVAEADEVFNRRQLKEARARRRVGTGSLSDVLNFEIRVNSARSSRLVAERDYRVALIGLAALLGVPDAKLPQDLTLEPMRDETDAERKRPATDDLVADALQLRPDLQQAHWAIEQAQADVRIAQAVFYPSVALAATLAAQRSDDPGFEGEDINGQLGLNLEYNLFAGGLNEARLQEKRERLLEVQQQMQSVRIGISSQVRDAIASVRTAQDALVIQRENAELVEKNRDLVEKEYRAGQGSLVRLNEAQRDLNQARSRLALALAGLRQAWFELRTATGGINAYFAP